MEHAPLPWVSTINTNLIVVDETGEHVVDCDELSERGKENKELILKAVNCYDDMLHALESVRVTLRLLADNAGDVSEWNEEGYAYETAEIVRKTIAKAKGK